MTDETDQQHRSEQISRAFALLTAKLEDAAALAVEGQGPQDDEALLSIAQQVAKLGDEVATIAGALAVLLSVAPGQGPAEEA